MLFMTFDITISCMAANRQKERHNDIPAKNQVDKVYNNKEEIK